MYDFVDRSFDSGKLNLTKNEEIDSESLLPIGVKSSISSEKFNHFNGCPLQTNKLSNNKFPGSLVMTLLFAREHNRVR